MTTFIRLTKEPSHTTIIVPIDDIKLIEGRELDTDPEQPWGSCLTVGNLNFIYVVETPDQILHLIQLAKSNSPNHKDRQQMIDLVNSLFA